MIYTHIMASELGDIRSNFLRVDMSAFQKLHTFFEREPVAARRACAEFMNSLAFKWRPLAVTVLASRLTMRAPRFILSQMRVEKTTAKPIVRQVVTVGSVIVRKGSHISFDGFYSLQTGRNLERDRNRTMTLFSRGGEQSGIVKRGYRLRPELDIPSTDEAPVASGSRAQFLIRDMAKNAPNKPFIIKAGLGFARGLYRIKPGQGHVLRGGRIAPKIQIIQRFGRRPHHERWKWMNESVTRLLKYAPISRMWTQAIDRVTRETMPK